MFASPYFDPARDWREIAIRAHQLLTQTAPDDLIDELTLPGPAPDGVAEDQEEVPAEEDGGPEELRRVA